MSKQMNLVAYVKTGSTHWHSGGWRHPQATMDIFSPERYERLAMLLESARFDGAFFADLYGYPQAFGSPSVSAEMGSQNSYLDPLTVLPIMARVTRHLGLGATISTTFHKPFDIARSLASIDILSGGRAAWNVVTSTTEAEAANAGMDELPPHDERYDRADDVLEACFALWNTWDDDPFLFDKAGGRFADGAKVRSADFEGRWVKTRGPLPTPRSPQGHPVILQAGGSPRGRDFAARWAEAIFSGAQTLEEMQEFYDDMHARMVKIGRDPSTCKILPGISVVLGETDSIAQERAEYLDSLQHDDFAVGGMSGALGIDLRKNPTAEEILAARGNQGMRSGRAEEFINDIATGGVAAVDAAARHGGRLQAIGTAQTVADKMESFFHAGVCDGFVILQTVHPVTHEEFCRAVVPELQRRGSFRTEYPATTMRANLLAQ